MIREIAALLQIGLLLGGAVIVTVWICDAADAGGWTPRQRWLALGAAGCLLYLGAAFVAYTNPGAVAPLP